MEKQIKDLFIVDGKKLKKLIKKYSLENSDNQQYWKSQTSNALKELQQSLIPLEGILEKAYNKGQDDYILSTKIEDIAKSKQNFLTKPIEIK